MGLHADGFFLLCHQLHFFEFWPLDSKVRGHLHELSGVGEVFGISAKFLQSRAKFTASHRLRNRKTKPAGAVGFKIQAEFTNLQFILPSR